ncbi:hypothetical protein EB796_004165 [Bugula neritina]|uniref:Uncharacterized protein n=1 Tax=Bugula neritina TaxID=10212 RepID=A0A7J7KG22_BUGNE|nr:hypothetical protein EB796_004165 [Bugula neritina]
MSGLRASTPNKNKRVVLTEANRLAPNPSPSASFKIYTEDGDKKVGGVGSGRRVGGGLSQRDTNSPLSILQRKQTSKISDQLIQRKTTPVAHVTPSDKENVA